jgi:hypothetical protein
VKAPHFDGSQPCASVGGDLWFPEDSMIYKTNDIYTAKRICAECHFRRPCLSYAVTFPGRLEGVWGGTTPKERKEIRKVAS